LQAATSQRTDQSLQKSVPAPPKKNFKIFFPALLKKIKTHDTQALTDKHSDNSVQTIYRQRNLTRTTEAHAHNKVLPKAGVTNFYETFVVYSTLVFQMNGSVEMPRLRQYPNRYAQCYLTTGQTSNVRT